MRYNSNKAIQQLTDFPGCNQICVSHSMFILPEHRGHGYASKAMYERIRTCKELGYDVITCTVNSMNNKQIYLLNKYRWIKDYEFKNTRTGHTVQAWHLTL